MSAPPAPSQVALVTGSSGGIGAAVARRLAKRRVSLWLGYGKRRDAAEALAVECHALGVDAQARAVDLSHLEGSAQFVRDCVEHYGRLDMLVHCAGSPQEELLATLDDDTLRRLVDVHVLATVALTRAALRPMLQQRAGRIVLLSSVAARQPSRGASVYAGCKGFVEAFVRAMAVEVGRKGVTVNAVAPGMVDTMMLRSVRGLVGTELAQRTALQRLATPDEIAAAVEFLCQEDSAYVNGHVLAVDGAYLGPP